MSDDIKIGDSVSWTSSGGSSKGRVKKKLTTPIEIKGHHVAASSDNPEFLVESESGGQAAHKPASLKKTSGAAKSTRKQPAANAKAASSAKKPSAKTAKKSTARKTKRA